MTIKARKFQIGEKGNPDYERLINSPLIDLIKEVHFSNFSNFFVVVHYEDNGYQDSEDRSGNEEEGQESEDHE